MSTVPSSTPTPTLDTSLLVEASWDPSRTRKWITIIGVIWGIFILLAGCCQACGPKRNAGDDDTNQRGMVSVGADVAHAVVDLSGGGDGGGGDGGGGDGGGGDGGGGGGD
ncbi:hypothetical protein AMAG_18846 [Allomyces macrogynus ATCC 38327]|uniref:Uncharacterized protein n=1 Tax=Allomyces macrogynus (strain ATCC 38327) TaxID=578462 RepID=A0A0L0SIL5_ALLM3|nr:hypothetical protein AMAG_18846 [Allomyces macrogynus ATCC 38327]|eukprot:KNE62312.1 hypothetical protein AMAG_18846 [Allomyces macrogynus ATCC 38327]